MSLRNGSLQVNGLFLKSIITSAYGVREVLISGLPVWAEEARYDIQARTSDAGPGTPEALSREQRRALMAAMLEDRFHLKVHIATKTLPVYDLVLAKGGPKFSESAGEPHVDARKNEFTAIASTALTVSYLLEEIVDRTVIDRTGLTSRYDFHVRWSPETAGSPDSDALPSIFTALQEQLGLKLQPGKGLVQTLVVDHIERPGEN
jgi:bla regulator protein BlaR1